MLGQVCRWHGTGPGTLAQSVGGTPVIPLSGLETYPTAMAPTTTTTTFLMFSRFLSCKRRQQAGANPHLQLRAPGQAQANGQGIAVELGTWRAALVRVVLQEGVLVPVQVVHQVAIAAVLGDDVDGACGEQKSVRGM